MKKSKWLKDPNKSILQSREKTTKLIQQHHLLEKFYTVHTSHIHLIPDLFLFTAIIFGRQGF